MLKALLACLIAACSTGCRPVSQRPTAGEGAVRFADPARAIANHGGDTVVLLHASGAGPGYTASVVGFLPPTERPLSGLWFHEQVAWAPDDHAFAAALALTDGATEIGVCDARTLRWSSVARVRGFGWPAWSTDGKRLAYEDDSRQVVTDAQSIYEFALDTGERRLLASGALAKCGNPLGPVPRGVLCRRLTPASGRTRQPLRYRYFVTSPQAGQREVLPQHFVERAAVSPSGRQLAALCLPKGATQDALSPGQGYTLYVVALSGAPPVRELCSGRFERFRWSASGDKLLLSARRALWPTAPWRMAVVNVQTGALTPLRDAEGQPLDGADPQWVDGDRRVIYLATSAQGHAQLWSYALGSGRTERLYPFGAD